MDREPRVEGRVFMNQVIAAMRQLSNSMHDKRCRYACVVTYYAHPTVLTVKYPCACVKQMIWRFTLHANCLLWYIISTLGILISIFGAFLEGDVSSWFDKTFHMHFIVRLCVQTHFYLIYYNRGSLNVF